MAKISKTKKQEPTTDSLEGTSFKEKALLLKARVNQEKKKVVVQTYSEDDDVGVKRDSSGILELDRILGGSPETGYGWARGRMHGLSGPESVGKSTILLHSIAKAQERGIVVLIDSECVYDPLYAQKLGVKIDELLVINPDTAEEAFDSLESLIKTGDISLAVVDSLDGCVPKQIVEASAEDQFMGVAARINNRFFAKVQKLLQEHDTTLIIVSQIREKIGVLYGCLHADTLINFTDGRSLPIRKVVDEQIEGEVWSWNEKINKFESKKIIDWHNNGNVDKNEDYIHFTTESIDSGNTFGFTVTPDHEVLTDDGFKKASEILIGDYVCSKYLEKINGTLGDFMSGMFVGDSHFVQTKGGRTSCISLQDNNDIEYIKWKIDKLSKFFEFKENKYYAHGKYLTKFHSNYSFELGKISNKNNNRNPELFLNNFNWLGMAIWICDDAVFDSNDYHNRYILSVKRFKNDIEIMDNIIKLFKNNGLDCSYGKDGAISFNKESSEIIAKNIAKYVPECMDRKLPEKYRHSYEEFELYNSEEYKQCFVEVMSKRIASGRQMRQTGKYDITVEDNHNYSVGGLYNGIIVHNSPETVQGGRGLKFYASTRIDVRRDSDVSVNGNNIGHIVKFKTVKNKTASPQQTAYARLDWGLGFNKYTGILALAVADGVVKKGGAGWMSFTSKLYGEIKIQGDVNFVERLKSDEPLLKEILKELGMS